MFPPRLLLLCSGSGLSLFSSSRSMAQTRHRETALAKPFPGLQRHTAIVSQPTTSFIASQEEACATHWARHPAIFANEISDQTPQWTKVPGRGNSLGRCLRLHQGPGNGSASWSISGAPCWGKAGCTETGMHLWIAALKPGHLRYEKNSLDKARILEGRGTSSRL